MSSVQIPALLDHQVPIADSPFRYKAVRAGRRFGKTRLAFHCAVLGHGGDDKTQKGGKRHRGIVSGLDVVWLAPTYPQAGLIWNEDVRPRFKGRSGVRLNESDRTVTLEGAGTLWVKSAEAVDGIRGIGANLAGVIIEEAAWLDLDYALKKVIRWALLDNHGWLLLISTTNAGHDGNAEKVMPSAFNRLCKEIMQGDRPEWAEFHGTAYDNPKLSQADIEAVFAEYVPGSLDLKQEGLAELVSSGAGLAFPEFTVQDHVCSTRIPPRSWRFFGSMDWGYRQGAYGLYAAGPDGEIEKVWEYVSDFKEITAREAPERIFKASDRIGLPHPEYVEADEQMWQQIGAGVTLAEDFTAGMASHFGKSIQSPMLLQATHKPGSRVVKKNSVHEMLASKGVRDKDGNLVPWSRPKFRVQDRCKETIRCYQTLPLDPKRPDDVDTTHPMDHVYDCDAFALTSRPAIPTRRTIPVDWENRDAGIDSRNKRVRDWTDKPDHGPNVTVPTLPSYQVPSSWSVSMSED